MKTKIVRTFRLSIKRWLHGVKDADKFDAGSQLYRMNDKKMCCLGQYLHACGVPIKNLQSVSVPSDIFMKIPEEARWAASMSPCVGKTIKTDAEKLMNENDTKARKSVIKSFFRKNGVDVIFVE